MQQALSETSSTTQVIGTGLSARSFTIVTRRNRSTYWINGHRVRAEKFFAAQSVAEGIAEWTTFAARQGEAA